VGETRLLLYLQRWRIVWPRSNGNVCNCRLIEFWSDYLTSFYNSCTGALCAIISYFAKSTEWATSTGAAAASLETASSKFLQTHFLYVERGESGTVECVFSLQRIWVVSSLLIDGAHEGMSKSFFIVFTLLNLRPVLRHVMLVIKFCKQNINLRAKQLQRGDNKRVHLNAGRASCLGARSGYKKIAK